MMSKFLRRNGKLNSVSILKETWGIYKEETTIQEIFTLLRSTFLYTILDTKSATKLYLE